MFENTYQNKRVLVTGHTGFKGAWLITWLLELGAEVHGLANGIPTLPSLYEVLGLADRIKQHHEGDVRDLDFVKKTVAAVRPDFIFHLAAQAIVKKSLENPLDTLTTNLLGHAHLLEAVRELDQPCVMVMVTSDKCYDNREQAEGYAEVDPLGGGDPYSASKAAAEIVVQAWQRSFFSDKNSPVRIATARAGNVIGGGDWAEGRIVPDCIRAWSEGKPVHLRKPNATRPWQHVLEPLSGYLRLGQMLAQHSELNGEAFNFGPQAAQNCTVLDLLTTLAGHWHFDDGAPKFKVDEIRSFQEAELLRLNCEKAAGLLAWQPVLHFEEAAALTGKWYHHFYQKAKQDMADYTLRQLQFFLKTATERGVEWAFR
ncbi:MAG: CDP-glucose 4,6-dehydratase [Bacteroidetes bacterium]|nr:CDP-glucose 4,6-dehydratase [Bacteroidota bacterium]